MTTAKTPKIAAPQTIPELPADLDLALRRWYGPWWKPRSPPAMPPTSWGLAQSCGVPGGQNLGVLRRDGILDSAESVRLPVVAGTDTGPTQLGNHWPAGTGKSHTLIGLGIAAVHAGHKVRYLTAADLVETLYRGLADDTVGRTIEGLLRQHLLISHEVGFAPLDDTGTQLLFRLVAGA